MSLSTEDRIKAFLNRQKDKAPAYDTIGNSNVKTDLNLTPGLNISTSFLKDKDDETLNTMNSDLPNITLDLSHKHSANPPMKTGDISSDLNFDDLEIRMEFIKPLANAQRGLQSRPRTYQDPESITKEKPKINTPKLSKRNDIEDMYSTMKSEEITNRRDPVSYDEMDDNPHLKMRSPLDKFFQLKTNTIKKIKRDFRNRSREKGSFSSTKSRNKTPPPNLEGVQESEIRSPRWNNQAVMKSVRSIDEGGYNSNSVSPRNFMNSKGSPALSKERKKGKTKKAVSIEKNFRSETVDSRSNNSRVRDSSQNSIGQAKVSTEIASLDKLLKFERNRNRDGYYGNNESNSIEKQNTFDSSKHSPVTPSKAAEGAALRNYHTRSQSAVGLNRKQLTPVKHKEESVDDDLDEDLDSYATIKNPKMFQEATKAIHKLQNEFDDTKNIKGLKGKAAETTNAFDSSSVQQGNNAFKKEMKEILITVNREKEQISKNLEDMSKKLMKYKDSYRSMKSELEGYRAKESQRLPQRNSWNLLEDEENSPGKKPLSMGKLKKKTTSKGNQLDFSEPFTVDQLNTISAKDQMLGDHVEAINNRIKDFVDKSPGRKAENKPVFSELSSLANFKQFEFDKYPTSLWIIEDLGLDSQMFNKNSTKLSSKDKSQKPKDKDSIIETQREMIAFLCKKLALEEKQRLATEEQAHTMISTMEKSLSQLEGRKKYQSHRKQDSTGAPGSEISKSTINERYYY